MKLRVIASLLSVLSCSAQAAYPAHYSVSSLGDLHGADFNNKGQVVGGFITGQYAGQAGIYSNGVSSTLAGLSGVKTLLGINDAGQIVGNAGRYDDEGFIYSGGKMTMLPPADSQTLFTAVAIDKSGNVGGTVFGGPVGAQYVHAAIYAGGTITEVSLGGSFARVYGISPNGTLNGQATTADDAFVGFTYQNGVITDYSSQIGKYSVIGDVNENNQMVGANFGDINFPSYFISGGVARYAGDNVGLVSLNNAGWAVGVRYERDASGSGGAVGGLLWIDGVSYDLNSLIDPALGWTITGADRINENNQILAEGCNANGCGSLLLSPLLSPAAAVPEPETYAMMLLGVGTVGLIARRRRKQVAAA